MLFVPRKEKTKSHITFSDVDIGEIFFAKDEPFLKIATVKVGDDWGNAVDLQNGSQGIIVHFDEIDEVAVLRGYVRVDYDAADVQIWRD